MSPETVMSAVVFSSGSAKGELSLIRPVLSGLAPHKYRNVTVAPWGAAVVKVRRIWFASRRAAEAKAVIEPLLSTEKPEIPLTGVKSFPPR